MSRISAKTRVCGILGHPVEHSLSPALHNAAFDALGLDFAYVAHDVLPADLPAAIAGARALGYRGLSVTIPHKVAALACVDEVDPTARAIGCVNTIVNEGGRLLGTNSDGRGALGALRAAGVDPAGQHVVLLGSGGAARALAMTLAIEASPKYLLIMGIIPEEVVALASDARAVSRGRVEGVELNQESLEEALAGAEVLLHATPVGMSPNADESLVPSELMRPGMVVFDAVYTPRRTRLLEEAEAAGATIVEGLEMFLGQARVQFELWTDQAAPLDVMRRVLEEKL